MAFQCNSLYLKNVIFKHLNYHQDANSFVSQNRCGTVTSDHEAFNNLTLHTCPRQRDIDSLHILCSLATISYNEKSRGFVRTITIIMPPFRRLLHSRYP